MNIYVISTILIVVLVVVWQIFCDRKFIARSDMLQYALKFTDTSVGCKSARRDYYDGIRKHNLYGIMFPEIGVRDSGYFHRLALESLERYMRRVQVELGKTRCRYDSLRQLRGDQIAVDVKEEMAELSKVIMRFETELETLYLDREDLKSPTIIPRYVLIDRLWSLVHQKT